MPDFFYIEYGIKCPIPLKNQWPAWKRWPCFSYQLTNKCLHHKFMIFYLFKGEINYCGYFNCCFFCFVNFYSYLRASPYKGAPEGKNINIIPVFYFLKIFLKKLI